MALSIKSIIQQAMLAAAPVLALPACGNNDVHFQVVIPSAWPDGGAVGSTLSSSDCREACGLNFVLGGCENPNFKGCDDLGPSSDGGTLVDCNDGPPKDPPTMCTGRRPDGLACVHVRGSVLGAHFARVAHLEAASVIAFRRLGRELEAHGAPPRLVRAAARAASDEVRHARAMRRVAARYGAAVPRVQASALLVRPLEAVAEENAVEGCVRETFGALVGAWQATHAQDARIRRTMATIADDEANHAQLAWDVHAWAQTKLPARARRRHAAQAAEAMAELATPTEPNRELVEVAGLPGAAVSRVLLGQFARSVELQ